MPIPALMDWLTRLGTWAVRRPIQRILVAQRRSRCADGSANRCRFGDRAIQVMDWRIEAPTPGASRSRRSFSRCARHRRLWSSSAETLTSRVPRSQPSLVVEARRHDRHRSRRATSCDYLRPCRQQHPLPVALQLRALFPKRGHPCAVGVKCGVCWVERECAAAAMHFRQTHRSCHRKRESAYSS